MPGLLRQLREQIGRRLRVFARQRQPENLPIELHRRRIYIVPTGFGLGFAILLLTMLAGALNYTNNAALLLTCLLGAASAASMLVAFRNLDGLCLRHIHAGHAIAGQPLELTLELGSERVRQAIRIDLGQQTLAVALDGQGSTRATLHVATERRGWQPLPRLRVWTTWPLGLFRAWSWLHPRQSILVWPRPETGGPPPQAPAADAKQARIRHGDEASTLRDYRVGDPQRHVAWKASARHDNLLVKDFEQPARQPQWQLDWRQLDGMDREARIARLARWVEEAQARQGHYSLWLPDRPIPAGSGSRHYVRCMNALAELP